MERGERACSSSEIKVEGLRQATRSALDADNPFLNANPLPALEERKPPQPRSPQFFEAMKARVISATPRRTDGGY